MMDRQGPKGDSQQKKKTTIEKSGLIIFSLNHGSIDNISEGVESKG